MSVTRATRTPHPTAPTIQWAHSASRLEAIGPAARLLVIDDLALLDLTEPLTCWLLTPLNELAKTHEGPFSHLSLGRPD